MKHAGLIVMATLAVLPVGSPAQAPAAQARTDCAPQGAVQFICGKQRPEDLVVVPGNRWVVGSEFGGGSGGSGGGGSLYLVHVPDRVVSALYPSPRAGHRHAVDRYPGCPGPPDAAARFAPHGLALSRSRGRTYTLHVVHHGSRESVEVFELDTAGKVPSIAWVGCAVAPDATFNLNSVVGLPDGGFIVTNFSRRDANGQGATAGARKGEITGEAWEWHPGGAWQKVPGSEMSGPNGVEMSKDGKWLYIGAWGSQSFIRLERGTATPRREAVPLGFRADNARWAPDGSLFIAGQTEEGAGGSKVVKVDVSSLRVTPVIEHPNTDAYGFGTVAIQVGREIWVGSYRADRVAVFPAPR